MMSLRVVIIISMLFTLASLMPGKKYLVETEDEDPEYGQSKEFSIGINVLE